MLDLVNGLPVHPLVVHGVVVLLPIAALGTLAMALRPAWRVRYGPLVVLTAAVGTALVPVATSSGTQLTRRVGNPGEHAELGGTLLWFAIPVLALGLLMWLLERRRSRGKGGPPGLVRHGVAVVAVLAAVALTVQVVRVGDSGARAVWGDRVQSAPAVGVR